jgi:transposase
MNEQLTVINERVDDIPLLVAHLEHMGVPALLDKHFPTHGNWQGLSLGMVATLWLSHILSEADHRLSHVQPWAEKRLNTLQGCTQQPVRDLDFSDDRLGDVAHALGSDQQWAAFEGELNQHLLRVYDLSPEQVRVDGTTASGYWQVTPDGLFQLGHSKDQRPDLPQVKVMLSTLDPLGMPLATDVVAGHRADDPLYIPAISRVRESLRRHGLLYVGDCKMAALETRAFVHAGQDYYLCPLAQSQLAPEELQAYLTPVWTGAQALTTVYGENEAEKRQGLAEGYERQETLTAVVAGQTITWTERRLVVHSLARARAGEAALRERLAKAQAEIVALNARRRGKKRFQEVAPLRQAAEAIVEKYGLQGLLALSYQEVVQERPVRRYRDRPASVRIARSVQVSVVVEEAALSAAVRRLGWRVYASNAPVARLTLAQAVLAYRHEYIIDRGMGRLKGRPLSLTPMYLQREDHAIGLIRLLSIGLRLLTLLEFTVRRRLAAESGKLAGLYAGNPKRATAQPTAELLLETFQEITLTVIQESGRTRRYLTPLSVLQKRILALLDFPLDIYTRLGPVFAQSP